MARFSAANAQEMGRRSAQARAKSRAKAEQRRLNEATIAASIASDPSDNGTPIFPLELKLRVRVQILAALSRLEEETAKGELCDGSKLDRLASAIERMADLERVLDNRPGPGTRRPPAESAPSARDNRVAAVPQLPVAPAPAAAAPPSASYVPTPQVSQPSPTTAHSKEDAQPRRLLTEPPEF